MPMAPIYIAPSLLAADFGQLRSEIQRCQLAGADWLHIDVMDGHFVPAITFSDNMVQLAKAASHLPLDVHLMVSDPQKQIPAIITAGASIITIHQEASQQVQADLMSIRAAGLKAGLSIKPGTPVEQLFEYLDYCDLVLIMTVNPGRGGQAFIPDCVKKIEILHQEIIRRKLTCIIEVDGGINQDTARVCCKAGASALVAGSYLFKQADLAKAITQMRSC